MIIGIDFDGTVVTHDFPEVGQDIGAEPVLKELVQNGHQLVLWTMRDGKYLRDAIGWFKTRDIPLYGIQTNPEQICWTTSPKAYCQLYIDDAGLGIPLTTNVVLPKGFDDSTAVWHDRCFVDWKRVRKLLEKMELI